MSEVEAAQAVAASLDGERLLERLERLARIGAEGTSGGVTRIAFSALEVEANDLLIDWLDELGLTVARDGFGNLFASTDGNAADGRPWLAGSHIDTVPSGGRFDGALGVVAAIEALAAIEACDEVPDCGLEVVIWRCEEPVRFAHGKVGSLLFTGKIAHEQLRPLAGDVALGMAPSGRDLPERPAGRGVGGCLELHIEQGRRLERARRRLGVVTAVASPIRLRLTVEGRADHSGATPMDDRRDALAGAAELVLLIERLAHDEAEHQTVATAARVDVAPGAMNVVPGSAELLVDVRGVNWESMQRLVQRLLDQGSMLCARRAVGFSVETLSSAPPTVFDGDVVSTIAETVAKLGHDALMMSSGAGHDAQCIQALAPAGMLFVPSIDGISHSPLESTGDEDVVLGARALAAAWVACASLQAHG